ncbi:MAG: PA2778 family cysteine peptidase [Candidatus Thiodiazotropha endolucinida]|nr:PA2778 family cysteine peptidase [Candidatus Thiodiazotropha taylori]MCW4342518.1 PA2778 family cysteine peptidase [Candidatus Thiodiazotropha endolucinida]
MAWRRYLVALLFLLFLLFLLLSGCTSRPPILPSLLTTETAVSKLEIETTPFHPQKKYQCGPAALATLLGHSGVSVTAESLVPLVYLPEKKGSLQIEMVAASRRLGRIPYVIEPDLPTLIGELQAGRPVLVLQNLGLQLWPVWHYAVVIGYSAEADEIILRSGITRREILSTYRFLDTWKRGGHWAMVSLKPGELPAIPEELPYLKAVAAMERLVPIDSLISAYRAALSQWPDSPTALFGLAAALHAKGDLTSAEQNYRYLLSVKPDHIAALNNLADVLSDRGCYGEALIVIERALRKEPGELRQHLVETGREIMRRKANHPHRQSPCE